MCCRKRCNQLRITINNEEFFRTNSDSANGRLLDRRPGLFDRRWHIVYELHEHRNQPGRQLRALHRYSTGHGHGLGDRRLADLGHPHQANQARCDLPGTREQVRELPALTLVDEAIWERGSVLVMTSRGIAGTGWTVLK